MIPRWYLRFSRSPTDVNSSVLTTDLAEANNLSFPVLQFTAKQLGPQNTNQYIRNQSECSNDHAICPDHA